MSSLNNLTITTTNRLYTSAVGAMLNTIHSKTANGGRDTNCKFYYNDGPGGSLLQVVAKSVVGGIVSDLKDEAVNAFNSLLNGKRTRPTIESYWAKSELEKQKKEIENFGKMELNGGGVLYALDEWGVRCPEALMLGIEVDYLVEYTQKYPEYRTKVIDKEKGIYKEIDPLLCYATGESTTLVWYDTTALISINSDKNLIATRVAGRDYSRKELVSNGDIKFTVTGQISSGKPDIYPKEEMIKFYQIMQYKGIIKVNNMVLGALGISYIVIESFSVSSKEGCKSLQQYTFNAIGLQPEHLLSIQEDTLDIQPQYPLNDEEKKSDWKQMFENLSVDTTKNVVNDWLEMTSKTLKDLI